MIKLVLWVGQLIITLYMCGSKTVHVKVIVITELSLSLEEFTIDNFVVRILHFLISVTVFVDEQNICNLVKFICRVWA
jgi:hypothetical protein